MENIYAGLGHIAVNTEDMAESIAFYQKIGGKLLAEDKIEKPEGRRGTIVCNPPYGERLMTPQEAEALYRDMGRAFAKLSPWQIYVITSHPQFERLYGQRADKIRKLYNGMIPCNLYQYFKPKDKK